MARYRQKDETDLVWNRARRRLTRELDTQLQDWREEALNKLLSSAWEKYSAALDSGRTLELEGDYETWVARALREHISLPTPDDLTSE
jgi:hypothetical protein